MSRLTRKNNTINKPYLEMCDLEMNYRHPSMYSTNCYTGKAVDKLFDLEEVLEEFGVESAEELKARLQSESQLAKAGYELALENEELTKQLKQSQNSKAIEVLEQVKENIIKNISPIFFQTSSWLGKQTVLDEIDNQITELRGGINDYEKSNSTSPIILG